MQLRTHRLIAIGCILLPIGSLVAMVVMTVKRPPPEIAPPKPTWENQEPVFRAEMQKLLSKRGGRHHFSYVSMKEKDSTDRITFACFEVVTQLLISNERLTEADLERIQKLVPDLRFEKSGTSYRAMIWWGASRDIEWAVRITRLIFEQIFRVSVDSEFVVTSRFD